MKRTIPLVCVTIFLSAGSPIRADGQPKSEGPVGAEEGPAWDGKGNLYFTGRNRIMRRDSTGKVRVFREPSGDANGLLFDFDGRLVICESANRRVLRLEPDGRTTVLADRYEGKRFNSPNDLTIDSKGRIYFSDPRYGSRENMEMRDGHGATVEGVYRIDAPGKVARVITHEVDRANGVLVSPRDQYLYVADNNNDTVGGARKLWRFGLREDGEIVAGTRTLIFDWTNGRGPDGFKMDRQGRLFVAAGLSKSNPPYEYADRFQGGIYVLSPAGKLIRFFHIPVDEVTNCAFGGADLKTLFITAGGTLWTLAVDSPGWSQAPHR
jgi:gluconolactonase